MDETDFQLLVHWYRDPFASFQELGRSHGLSGTAVKHRVDALRKAGVLQGFWAIPIAEVFGRHPRIFIFDLQQNPAAGILSFRLKQEPRGAIESVLRNDTVVWVKVYKDDSIAVLCYLNKSVGAPEDLLALFGSPSMVQTPKWHGAPDRAQPVPTLSPLDWRILRAMVSKPRASPAELGEACRLTEKTARRRRDALVTRGIVQVQPLVNGGRSRRLACYYLGAFGATGSPPPNVASVTSGVSVGEIAEPPGTIFLCRSPSLAEAQEEQHAVLAIPGVKAVGFAFRLTTLWATDRLKGWIDEQLAYWESRAPQRASLAVTRGREHPPMLSK